MNLQQLATATGAGLVRSQEWFPYLIRAMDEYGIDTAKRQAAFLSQIGHESGSLRFTTEVWNPSQVPAQGRYEGRKDLGNTQPGDGFKFRGHGLIQVTGRANHAAARDRLRVKFGPRVPDFEQHPEALALPEWAALSAGDYWHSRGLNVLADAGDIERITRRINGGLNGLDDRKRRYQIALKALGV